MAVTALFMEITIVICFGKEKYQNWWNYALSLCTNQPIASGTYSTCTHIHLLQTNTWWNLSIITNEIYFPIFSLHNTSASNIFYSSQVLILHLSTSWVTFAGILCSLQLAPHIMVTASYNSLLIILKQGFQDLLLLLSFVIFCSLYILISSALLKIYVNITFWSSLLPTCSSKSNTILVLQEVLILFYTTTRSGIFCWSSQVPMSSTVCIFCSLHFWNVLRRMWEQCCLSIKGVQERDVQC